MIVTLTVDFRKEVLRNVSDLNAISVDGMTNYNPIRVDETMTVSDMIAFLKSHQFPINYLPVVDEQNRVKGVVSFLNLVKGEL